MLQRICSLLRVQPPVLLTRGLLWVSGATVPTDGTDGYQTGCLFQKTDGGSGTALYINEGSVISCDFNAVDAGGITTSIDVGVFSSLTAGDGIALSSSDRSAVAIYGDDAGLSIASNVYNLRTRLLLTVDQDGASIRALMAQLKLADTVDVSTGIYTASQGYVELAGDTSVETGATFSCFDASLEIGAGNTLTVDNNGEACGIHIETTGTGTITNNGTCTGALITKAASAPSWPTGITIIGTAVQHAILVGSTTDGEGVVLSATVTKAVGIYAELETDAGSGYNVRPLRSRLRIDVSGNVETETYGIQGQLNVYASNLGHWHAGILGSIERSGGTVTVYNPLAGAGAVIGRVGGAIEITTASWVASFVALSNATMTLTSGQYMGLYVTKTSGKTNFSRGIYIDGSAVDYGIMVGEHSNTVGDGVTVSDTTKRIVGFFADDNAVGTAGGAFISVARGRLLVTGSTCSGEQYGLHGTVIYRPAASVSINGWTAGILGTLEGATGMTVSSVAGAVAARVGFGSMRPTVAGRVAGVFSLNNMAAELTSGTTSAFLTYTVGTVMWTNGLEIYADSCVTGISINTCATGITFAGTLAPNTTYGDQAIAIGTRGAVKTITFAATGENETFEPIQMNFACAGTNPDATSTVNIWQGGLTHTSAAMAALRLKWSDLLTTVSQNCMDVFIHQAELKFSGSPTVSGQTDVLGLVLDGGSGSPTCASYRVINATLRGSGTPVGSAGIMVNAEGGIQVGDGIRVMGTGIITAFRVGNGSYTESPTHFLGVPTAGTQPVNADASAANVKAEGSIAIRVGNQTRYIQYFNANS